MSTMHELPAAPTAADDRDQFGRPKAELAFGQLLAVTAYWLAITVLWGAFTFSVIPRLVESDGVLGRSDSSAGRAGHRARSPQPAC